MKKGKIPSVNDVQPGVLVVHRYTPEVGIVTRVNWGMVEVLLGNGSVVRWEFEGFRSVYEVISEKA
jgi:hypothetical protein